MKTSCEELVQIVQYNYGSDHTLIGRNVPGEKVHSNDLNETRKGEEGTEFIRFVNSVFILKPTCLKWEQ